MQHYFPALIGTTSVASPTIDIRIRAALFAGRAQVALVSARYQYQTWGGTRPPERRLTDQLGPIRNLAAAGDFLLIERSLSDPLFFRLTLLRSGTPEHTELAAKVGNRRWGPVDLKDRPVAETDVLMLERAQSVRELAPFTLFDSQAVLQEARVQRVARSQAFKRRLLPLYDWRCSVCGLGHAATEDLWEAEAAHIVPRALKGADDARNGLVLCRSHHWAFDRGLFGVQPDRRIYIRAEAAAEPRNAHLARFGGQPLRPPHDVALQPSGDALAWHMANVVRR